MIFVSIQMRDGLQKACWALKHIARGVCFFRIKIGKIPWTGLVTRTRCYFNFIHFFRFLRYRLCHNSTGRSWISVMEKYEQLIIQLACNINLLACRTDEKVKLSVVFDQQLVMISLACYSVTKKSPFTVTRLHPQAHGKRRQIAGHTRDQNIIFHSFVWKMESVVLSVRGKRRHVLV